MKRPIYQDFPYDEVCETAKRLTEQGIRVYQKFTCAGCGARLTIDRPGYFCSEGTCDRCPAVTDIAKQGCNYTIIGTPDQLADIMMGGANKQTEH